jgi:hypothetical protein
MEVAMPTDCGCPAPATPVLLASADPVSADANQMQSMHLGQPNEMAKADPPSSPAAGAEARGTSETGSRESGPEAAPLPPLKPNEKHVHIDVAPIIFQASAQGTETPSATASDERSQRQTAIAGSAMPPSAMLPPPPTTVAAPKRAHHGFFGKIKGLIAKIF